MLLLIFIGFILYIITSGVISGSESIETLEGFTQKISIDDIKFNDTVETGWQKRTKISSFPLPVPLETIEQPPKNSDPEVKKEIKFLHKLTVKERTKDQQSFARSINQKDAVVNLFINYCGKNGLIYDEKHLRSLSYDLETYCIRVKNLYRRPRPQQLAAIFQIPIDVLGLSKSSSYPACPTFVSKVLAHVISYNNPSKAEVLHGLAKKIELSRLYGGYNYPSDNLVSLKMADVFHKYVKHLEA